MPQDFSQQNLRGLSFRNQNLNGADFSGADIRGADFTNAKLIGADFRSAKAGLQRRWVVGLVVCSWLLAGFSGLFSAIVTAAFTTYVVEPANTQGFIIGIVSLITFAIFFIVVFRKGLVAGVGVGAIVVALAIVVAGAAAAAVALAIVVAGAITVAITVAVTIAVAVAGAGAGVVALAITVAVAVAVAGGEVVAGAGAGAGALALAVAVALARAGALALAGAVAVGEAVGLAYGFARAGAGVVAVAVAVAVALALASAYIGWLGWAGDEKYAVIRSFAVAFAATGGTSFRGADLTDANFTIARLKSTDFREAILTRTCWHKAKMLERVRPGVAYLQNTELRQVLTTGLGQEKNFDRQDLRGVNFKGANLADASFIGANLSGANLQDTNLSRAKLVQTQLDETDLAGATLTGAYIEDWGITSHTKLDGVRCEYVFMRVPTKEDPNPRRKPDNWEEKFEDGDFADFIKPIVDTLDL